MGLLSSLGMPPPQDLLQSLIVPEGTRETRQNNMTTEGSKHGYLPIRNPRFSANVDAQIEDNHEEENYAAPPEQTIQSTGKPFNELFDPNRQTPETGGRMRQELNQYIQSLDEWESQNPRPEKEDDPFVRPKIVPLLATKTTGEHAAQFNQFCQKYGLDHDFHIKEGPPQCFSAKVTWGDNSARAPGPFASKKEAKEAVCKLANMQNEKIKENLTPFPNRKQSFDEGPDEANAKRQRESENWVGMLAEYCQKLGQPMPQYTEYQARAKHLQAQGVPSSGYQFACTVTLPHESTLFGDTEALFNNKKEAKRNAAMEAVQYLRSNSAMGGAPQLPTIQPNTTASSSPMPSIASTSSATGETTPAKVARLSIALGFSQPSYQKSHSAGNSTLISMAAFYLPQDQQKEPKISGPLGLVEGVHGQKAAKQQCAEKVVELLEGLQTKRLAEAKEVWAGRKPA
ncbi:hypothetical protein MBLNU230_g5420t1 [Neophaeotheca triangularis]